LTLKKDMKVLTENTTKRYLLIQVLFLRNVIRKLIKEIYMRNV